LVRRWLGGERGPSDHGGVRRRHSVRQAGRYGVVHSLRPDLDAIVESVSEYWEAGFTDIALVQVGDDGQDLFLKEAAGPLLEKLRASAG
jgi:hypothetical protein